MNENILAGRALWSFKYEVMQRNPTYDIGFHITGVKPFHRHVSEVVLTSVTLECNGVDYCTLPLEKIVQLYLGFDEVYSRMLIKNFGMTVQPLRISTNDGQVVYFIIDYSFWGSANRVWFDTIRSMIS